MALLTLFLLRLCFGLALGMAVTSPRSVASGYFRNHLYVTLGLATLAALLSRTAAPDAFAYAVATAVASYAGSVAWLYEKPKAGLFALLVVTNLALCGAFAAAEGIDSAKSTSGLIDSYDRLVPDGSRLTAAAAERRAYRAMELGLYAGLANVAANVTSGLLLGFTMAAMLLGHWYLNAPGMQLAPLRRLLILMGIAVALHATVCGFGLWMETVLREPTTTWWLFVALRWSFGLVGVVALIAMAWQTLAIPNTQSATGILYVAVIGTFVGEAASLLMSAETLYPV